MSVTSQENNMRRLAVLLGQDLSYIHGEKECGPNGAKKAFLNVGKAFLRSLAKDLGLRDARVTSNGAGIAVSGSCTLIGMWEERGIYVCLEQPACGKERVACYRTVRHIKDFKGGYPHFLTHRDLQKLSYSQLLETLGALRKDSGYERAA